MKNQKGFSLIELLIVVVIIGIIAAIAIPNLLAARRSANEGSAASSLRTIHGSSATYQATSGVGNFPGNATAGGTSNGEGAAAVGLQHLGTANLIDSVLAGGGKSGYTFGYVSQNFVTGAAPTPASFAALATPQVMTGLTMTGTRDFGVSTDGVLATAPLTTARVFSLSIPSPAAGATFGSGGTVMGNQ